MKVVLLKDNKVCQGEFATDMIGTFFGSQFSRPNNSPTMKQLVPGESQFPGLFKNALKLCLASKMRHEIAGEVRGDHISCKFALTDLIIIGDVWNTESDTLWRTPFHAHTTGWITMNMVSPESPWTKVCRICLFGSYKLPPTHQIEVEVEAFAKKQMSVKRNTACCDFA